MSDRDNNVYLKDISESIEIIFQHVRDLSEKEFSENILVQDAVFRRFEIIGEASKEISNEFKSKHPEIEWRLMRAMRNKLSHEYFGVTAATVYHTVKSDLPLLLEKINALL